ncbi:MAG TPA: helix-turn-helix domain-containing protein [Mycobacteriales bacterium]|nr:helix-turn-helix domain-containing protein [Mycobacteriales bacterium]
MTFDPETLRQVEQATAELARSAAKRMKDELPWFDELSAEERSWVGVVAHAGIRTFVDFLGHADDAPDVAAVVFGAAPPELVRAVSLQQTVELVRLVVDTVEHEIPRLAVGEAAVALREATLRFSREVAFAAAELYARAAEQRGAWHARQQAVLIDSLVRGDDAESIRGRALALGWTPAAELTVLVGTAPSGLDEHVIDEVEAAARHVGLDALAGLREDRLIVVAGAPTSLADSAAALLPRFGKGAVVRSQVIGDLTDLVPATQEAIAAARVCAAWPDAPALVSADALLPERALAGDPLAVTRLVALHHELRDAGPDLISTVAAYLHAGASIEATARATFLHANTVRYRLRKVASVTGIPVTEPRGAFTLQCALVVGRLAAD